MIFKQDDESKFLTQYPVFCSYISIKLSIAILLSRV